MGLAERPDVQCCHYQCYCLFELVVVHICAAFGDDANGGDASGATDACAASGDSNAGGAGWPSEKSAARSTLSHHRGSLDADDYGLPDGADDCESDCFGALTVRIQKKLTPAAPDLETPCSASGARVRPGRSVRSVVLMDAGLADHEDGESGLLGGAD